ncbi:MAG: Uma2 family endonuclease [Planctomycetes bacterium]|nr:Uma2 family endonuclease [Planctomycetota bacterium]
MSNSIQPFNADAAVADPDVLYEVVDGQWREIEPMGALEGMLATELVRYLGNFVFEHKRGFVGTEILFELDADRRLRRRPDVAFVSFERWPRRSVPRTEAWPVVPDLAVEVVSPTNRAEDINEKLTDYFAAGVRLVWVLYPEPGRIYVYTSPTQVRGLERSETLDGGDVLPGFSLPIERLYERLEGGE